VAAAALVDRVAIGEYPSEAWLPYPSESWSPRVAMLNEPTFAEPLPTPDLALPTDAAEPVPPPPLEEKPWDGQPCPSSAYVPTDLPRYAGCMASNECRPHSSYMRSLCRYGLIAPPTPGVDSAHSPYLNGPTQWGPPVHDNSLFAPPPCEGSGMEQGAWGRADHRCATVPSSPQTVPGSRPSEPLGARPGLDPSHPSETEAPCVDPRAQLAPYSSDDFTSDPFYCNPYDPCSEQGVYGDKYLNPTQRPLIEWGMPFYLNGPVPPPSDECGPTNPALPRFYLYGDYRAAAAYNQQNGQDQAVLAQRLNLEWDLWLTSTERFHMFTGPLQRGNNFQRVVFDDGDAEFFDEMDFFDAETDTAFFEGDLGYMLGGWTGRYAPFDLPITAGLIPLLFQNGVWMEDAIVGAAATIPARNSPLLDWSNYDVTFFCGFDQVTSPAFEGSQTAANVFGATTMIEAKGGYIEAGYAFLDDTVDSGLSYNNVGISYTRRYLNLVSNSMRVIVNTGQDGPIDDRTAQGVLLIAENSFLTPWPYNVIPYVNMWAGFDDPQSVARAGAAGGVLRNEGILFESDNLTGYPTLDATANDTWGGAVGIDLLAPEFTHQLILEVAIVQVFGDDPDRNAPGDQYGIGARYQVPISNATLLRFDTMYGWLEDADNVAGARAEFRWKF
jgi:hypothetical protein